MNFVNLHFSYLFLVVLGLIVFLIVRLKNKEALLSKFAKQDCLEHLAASYNKKNEILKKVIIIISALLIVVGLLRPQWGFVWEEVEHKGTDVMIAVDVSKSMLTKDVLPNRIERTKLALEDLAQQLQADRIGLIAFAGTAFVQCPLTIDHSGFLLSVKNLNTQSIPALGTNIEKAIIEAINSFDKGSQGTKRTLIIITDGESHEGDALKAAEKAQEANIKIHTIGVGTTQGELIETKDEEGNMRYLKDKNGQIVKSRLDEKVLQEIAFTGQGIYIKSTATEFGLERLYNSKIATLEKKQMKSTIEKRKTDRFQLPIALAFLLLFIEPFINNRKRQ